MATTTMADLCEDLVVKILSLVPLTSLGSVRRTCKKWNALSKNQIFGKVAEAKNQFLRFVVMGARVCSLRCEFQGICNDSDDFVNLSIKQVQVSLLNQIPVYKAYQCDGLVLCRLYDKSKFLVWNPYLGQTRCIPHEINILDEYAFGCDSKGNHKILKISEVKAGVNEYAIYDFSSDSWRVLDVTPNWEIPMHQNQCGVSLKANTYFYAQEIIITGGRVTKREHFLICFDFTSERFGPRLCLPFHSPDDDNIVYLSCVRDEKIAVLHRHKLSCPQTWLLSEVMDIWVSNKIDHNEILWTKLLEVDMKLLTGFLLNPFAGNFFIDDDKKVAVVFDLDASEPGESCGYQTAHIFGQDGYFKSVSLEEAPYEKYARTQVLCSSYVPSLMQIE